MSDARLRVYIEALTDLAVLAILTTLMLTSRLDVAVGVPLVAALAGGHVASRSRRQGTADTTGAGPSVPPTAVLAVLALLAGIGMSGCGGANANAPSAACSAVRAARNAAELAEPYVCEMPDAGAAQ